jgi:hypothetical protein
MAFKFPQVVANLSDQAEFEGPSCALSDNWGTCHWDCTFTITSQSTVNRLVQSMKLLSGVDNVLFAFMIISICHSFK